MVYHLCGIHFFAKFCKENVIKKEVYEMKFLDIVKEIQNLPENEGYLVLVRCGIFF